MWKLKLKERDEEIQKLTMDNETLAKENATLKSGIENVQMLWKKYM
jgi:cell division protein FtsB